MIPRLFADKEDPFVTSDDEETENMLVNQRLFEKVSSFLGRVSSHSLPSKQRSSTTRSFIFGRDDSKISEDSSDAVAKDIRLTQKATAKFTGSLAKSDNMVGMTQTIFSAFKIPKMPVKVEGRTKY
ncbi:hypothetical protein POM88_054682 [Heracleum sosnowskyi]|uniref:Uncharacterized protein n=1 Tax=Heracleum sosnowskyi TaxID=360622 RepID=A0AAD8LWM1_9APIA|nr:hypothetical protein POM88_054682 [Heracleum sosnowskyi]